jgi:hypothetical protein
MAHHGEIGWLWLRTCSRKSLQSTHLASATSAGSGFSGPSQYAAYTGHISFSSTPSIRAW